MQSLTPGYEESGAWKSATELTPGANRTPYSDRIGHGQAMEIGCQLGPLTGKLLLVDYEDGKLGCRLSVSNPEPAPAFWMPTHP